MRYDLLVVSAPGVWGAGLHMLPQNPLGFNFFSGPDFILACMQTCQSIKPQLSPHRWVDDDYDDGQEALKNIPGRRKRRTDQHKNYNQTQE